MDNDDDDVYDWKDKKVWDSFKFLRKLKIAFQSLQNVVFFKAKVLKIFRFESLQKS